MEIIAWIVIGGLVGFMAGRARGREPEGVLVGIIFGPIGWLIMLCAQDKRHRCPECRGVIFENASRCCNCGSTLGWSPVREETKGPE